MGNHTSENSYVLATHEDAENCGAAVNVRMLLMHVCCDGRLQYVIGSYFTEHHYDGALGYECIDYEWDWGHYFDGEGAFERAVEY